MRLPSLPLQHLLLAASIPLRCSRRPIVSMCAEEFPLITSSTNPRLKLIKRLHAKKHREREGLVLLEGQRLVMDALELGQEPTTLLVAEELLQGGASEQLLAAVSRLAEGAVVRVPMSLLTSLSDTMTPQGVLAVLPQPTLALPAAPSLVLVLDRIADPGNMGTILRSATGAGAQAAVLLPGCCDPWGPKPLRAGMGAQLRLPLLASSSWEEASRTLGEWGCSIVAADAGPGGVAHFALDWRQPRALVLGSEAHGVADEILSDGRTARCHIPMTSGIESLNAAMAGSVMLFEAQRQRLGDGAGVRD